MITHDPYKVLTSWNDSFHFCDWSGISCAKRHKRVTALRLGSQGLEGSLSPHVGNLSYLRELYLRNNSFQGAIPHERGRLSRLRRLYLNRNKFSGYLEMSNNSFKLRYPEMSNNSFSGKLTIDFSKLRDINVIRLSDNNFHGRGEADDM
nr:protein kinase-like domain-containing protein [Tanacetum cinerariifolium]